MRDSRQDRNALFTYLNCYASGVKTKYPETQFLNGTGQGTQSALASAGGAFAATGRRKGAPSRLNAFIAAIAIVRSTKSFGANAPAAAA